MGNAFIIRYRTRPDAAEENQGLVGKVFAELAAADPGGMRYATLRDGDSFVHIVVHENDQNPLPRLAAFQEFQRGIAERCVEAPERSEVSVVGAYRMLTG